MARNKGGASAPIDDTIEDPATIAEMNEAAGERAERAAAMMEAGAEALDDDDAGGLGEELVEEIEDALGEAMIDLRSLRGDLRDAMLEQFKRRPKPWGQMSESEQRDVIAAVNNGAERLIVRMVQLIASADRVQVTGTLESLTVKDGIKATLKAPYSVDSLHALGEAQGKQVLIVVADAGGFMGQRREPKADPDQRELIPSDDSDLVNQADPSASSPFGAAAEVGERAAADFAADEAAREAGELTDDEAGEG